MANAVFQVDGSLTELPPKTTQATFYATVKVDPFALLTDPQPGNNSATGNCVISNDVSYSLTNVTASPFPGSPVTAGTVVTLSAMANTTSPNLQRVPWTLYVGDPAFGGTAVQSGVVEIATGRASFAPVGTTTGPATLFVLVLDPQNTLGNNTPWLARASYVYSYTGTDLGIGYNDISFSPTGPAIGDTSTVAATVHNYGDAGATGELYAFLGDPTVVGSTQLASFPLSIAAGQTQQISFPWTREGAQTNLYFKITDVVPQDVKSLDDSAVRNAFLVAVYTSGRADSLDGAAPYVSSVAIGDLLGTGNPVIACNETLPQSTRRRRVSDPDAEVVGQRSPAPSGPRARSTGASARRCSSTSTGTEAARSSS